MISLAALAILGEILLQPALAQAQLSPPHNILLLGHSIAFSLLIETTETGAVQLRRSSGSTAIQDAPCPGRHEVLTAPRSGTASGMHRYVFACGPLSFDGRQGGTVTLLLRDAEFEAWQRAPLYESLTTRPAAMSVALGAGALTRFVFADTTLRMAPPTLEAHPFRTNLTSLGSF